MQGSNVISSQMCRKRLECYVARNLIINYNKKAKTVDIKFLKIYCYLDTAWVKV